MTNFNVPDMSCGHCKAAIEKAVGAADATAGVTFDMEKRMVTVASSLSDTDISTLLEKEGYPNSIQG